MFADGPHILVEQLRHLPLGQPDGFPVQTNLGDAFSFVLVDEYRQLVLRGVHGVLPWR
ncbi:hypothetical protein D9M69_704710 [compost metagenome]